MLDFFGSVMLGLQTICNRSCSNGGLKLVLMNGEVDRPHLKLNKERNETEVNEQISLTLRTAFWIIHYFLSITFLDTWGTRDTWSIKVLRSCTTAANAGVRAPHYQSDPPLNHPIFWTLAR